MLLRDPNPTSSELDEEETPSELSFRSDQSLQHTESEFSRGKKCSSTLQTNSTFNIRRFKGNNLHESAEEEELWENWSSLRHNQNKALLGDPNPAGVPQELLNSHSFINLFCISRACFLSKFSGLKIAEFKWLYIITNIKLIFLSADFLQPVDWQCAATCGGGPVLP